MDNEKTGKYIAECRKRLNLTQQQLADSLGITNKAVSKWERGQGMPDVSILTQLSQVLGISVDSILHGYDNQDNTDTVNPDPVLVSANIEISWKLFDRKCKYIDRTSLGITGRLVLFAAFLLLAISAFLGFILKWTGIIHGNTVFYITFCLLLFIIAVLLKYKIKAWMQFRKFNAINGNNAMLSIFLCENSIRVENSRFQTTYLYEDITHISQIKDYIIIKLRNEDFIIEDKFMKDSSTNDLIKLLNNKCISAEYELYSKKDFKTNVLSLTLIYVGLLFFVMQMAFIFVGSYYRIEYIYEQFFYIVNFFIIGLIIAGCTIYMRKRRKAVITLIIAAAIMFGANSIQFAADNFKNSIVSASGIGGNTLVLKRDAETGKTGIYRKELLWFVRAKDSLPYTVSDGYIKLQWLTDDICAVTYMSPDDETFHQYVATYGDRGNGSGYYNVTSVLSSAKWLTNERDWGFSSNSEGYVISHGEESETFSFDKCEQYGTIVIVLYDGDTPKWTIALNDDCSVNGGALEGEGSITICRVSMDKTAAVTFNSL